MTVPRGSHDEEIERGQDARKDHAQERCLDIRYIQQFLRHFVLTPARHEGANATRQHDVTAAK